MQTPSQTEVWSTMGESTRPSSFYNPTLSATSTHAVQICRFSLSAAADGLADDSGERRTSPFNGDAQSWNGIERSLGRAVVLQSLSVSVTTFPTALCLYCYSTLHMDRAACERASTMQAAELLPKRKKKNIKPGFLFLLACQENVTKRSTAVWPANAKLQLLHRQSS